MSFPHIKDAYWLGVGYGADEQAKDLGVEMNLGPYVQMVLFGSLRFLAVVIEQFRCRMVTESTLISLDQKGFRMFFNSPSQPVLVSLLPGERSLGVKVAIAAAGSVLLTISGKIQVPFYPVPVTMQMLVVLALGVTLGSRLAFAMFALYLAEGLAGLPVAGTPEKEIGLTYVMGPTGGYLLGYLIAATLTGWLVERGFDKTLPKAVFALVPGNLAIYVPGLLWLGAAIGWDKPILHHGLIRFWRGTHSSWRSAPAFCRCLGTLRGCRGPESGNSRRDTGSAPPPAPETRCCRRRSPPAS